MKKAITILIITWITLQVQAQNDKNMDRIEQCKKTFTELFGGEALTGQGTDPELMDILQKFIFGEVFYTGNLSYKTRELITCVTLATSNLASTGDMPSPLSTRSNSSEITTSYLQCCPFHRLS